MTIEQVHRWEDEPAMASESLDAEAFKKVFRRHAAGVALITADAGDGPVALTATSVFSISAVPPLLAFSLSDESSAAETIGRAETLVVHLLSADQLGLAKLGATTGIDRFADDSIWERLATGEPYFPAVHTWIRGRIANRMRAGNSTVLAVRGLEARWPQAPEAEAPLVYVSRTWHALDARSRIA
ncbi:MAG TPA: flavin reductase family protein [Microbacteriaceae bacterium]|nr:flavin reductase family protein [Microbacteriaceae bacterium]